MKWLQSLLLLVWTTHIAPQDHSVQKREASDGEKKVVCYYTNWSVYRPGTAKFTPQNINPYLCTHLIYAFGGLDRENGLRPYDKYQDIEQGGYAKFTGLKTFNKKLKTLLAIGGWNEGSARFSPLVADEERRREFVKNVVKFLRVNHFDGLDLDWEYPSFRDGGKPKDRENYASLVQELREEFDRESSKTGRPRMLLTMAVPAGIEYINKGYDVEKLNKYLDFMNILSYDYHSAFEPAVNHHSPLYPLEEESEYNFDAQLSIDYTIKHYLKAGADRQKLVLGIPTYGRSYTLFNKESNQLGAPADGPGEQGDATREKGYLAYYEICSSVKEDSNWTVEQPKAEAMGPYAYKGNQWVGYDDEDIVKLKAQYVNEKGLGGIMFWSIDNDDFRGTCHGRPNPLIEAGKEALYGTAGPSNNLISSSETKVVTQVPSTTRRSKPRTKPTARTTPTSKTTPNPLTTPEPPTTPDPGSDFKCKDEGFFPHPRDCKKYFWCLDSGPSNLGIVAHQFTCPSGLFFNKAADSCDYTRNVFCNKKSSSTDKTSSASTKVITATAKTTSNRQTTTTTTAPTTTTTEAVIIEEEEYEEEDSAEEDPKAIKQLITLIKKLGGVAELEKQLNLEHSPDVTTPAISRTLYNKVLNTATPRYQSKFRNGPGPQNEGLKPDQTAASRKEKPQYVTIRRERPSTEAPNDNEDEETEIETQSPKYKSIQRTKSVDESSQEEEEVQEVQTPKYASIFRNRNSPSKEPKSSSPKYVTLQRNRASQAAPPVEEEVDEGPSSESSPKVITPKYVTLRRQRPQLLDPESEDQEVKNKEITIEDNPVTEVTETSSTIKPRVKVSPPSNIMKVIIVTPEPVTSSSPTKLASPRLLSTTLLSTTLSSTTLPPTTLSSTTPSPSTPSPPTPVFEPSTSTRVVTTIVEAATERQVIPVNKLEYFLAKHSSGIRNIPINSEIIHNDVQKLDAEIINKLKKSHALPQKALFNETKSTDGSSVKQSGITLKSRFNPPSNRTKSHSGSFKPSSNSTESDTLPVLPSLSTKKSYNSTNFNNYFKRRQNSRFLSLNSSTTPEPLPVTEKKFVPSRSRIYKTTQSTNDGEEDETSDAQPLQLESSTPVHFSSQSRRKLTPSIALTTALPDLKKRRVLLRGKPNSPESSVSTTTVQEPKSSTIPQNSQSTLGTQNSQSTPGLQNSQSTLGAQNLQASDTDSQQDIIRSIEKEEKIELNEDKRSLLPDDKNRIKQDKITPEYTEVTQTYLPQKNSEEFKIVYEDATRAYISAPDITTFKPYRRGKIRAQDYLQKLADELGTEIEDIPNSKGQVYQRNSRNQINSKYDYNASPRPDRISKSKDDGASIPYSTQSSLFRRNNSPRTLEPLSAQSPNEEPQVASDKPKIYRGSVRAYHVLQSDKSNIDEYIQATTKRGNPASTVYGREQVFISTRKPYAQVSRDYSSQESNIDSVVSSNSFRSKKPKEDDNKIVTLRGVLRYSADDEKPKRTRGNVIHAEYFENQRFQPTTESHRSSLANRGSAKAVYPNNILLQDLNNGQLIHLQAPLLAHSLLANEKFFEDNQSILNENIDNSPISIQSREISNSNFAGQSLNDQSTISIDSGNKIDSESPDSKLFHEIQVPRNRTQFRRPNASILRTRSTAKPSTEAPEPITETPRPPNKLFRRRKIRPDTPSSTLSTTTVITEEPASNIEAITSRGRKIEFPRRVNKSNYNNNVPEAAALQYTNSSLDYEDTRADSGSVSNRIGSLEESPSSSNIDKISDLANVAVVAIHNLATIGPGLVTTKIDKVPVRQLIVTQPPPPLAPTIPIVVAPIKKYNYRGNVKPYLRQTTSAPAVRPPSPYRLQDPLFDYDSEYYAEPVDVPLSGKVRIHNDGYIECLDVGNFPHPFSCRKFISCAKMENGNLLGWEYTCPRGLSFDPIGGMCNWSAGLGCKE